MKSAKSKKPVAKSAQAKKRSKQKMADVFRTIFGLLMIAVVIAAMFASYRVIILHKNLLPQKSDVAVAADTKVEGDNIFRNYLVKLASSKSLEVETAYSEAASDTKMTGKTIYNAGDKKLSDTIDMQCTTRAGGGNVRLSASVQSDNATSYTRINSLTGTFVDSAGKTVDAGARFTAVFGKWYQEDGTNTATLQTQIDKGVFVLQSGVIAPKSDSKKVADALINSKALEPNVVKNDDGSYKIFIKIHKSGYVLALKQAFPNMSGSDKVVDALFGNGDVTEMDSTVVVRKDGTLVSQQTTQSDSCQVIVDALGGVTSGAGGLLTEDDTVKPKGSLHITPVTGAHSQIELQQTLAR